MCWSEAVPFQLFRARVSRVRDLTHDVRELDLDLVSPPEIAFVAGQFISFEIRVPGSPYPVTRPYSIASPPRQSRRVTLLFNRVPDGPGSGFLYGLRPGDEVQFKGVAGMFQLENVPGRDSLFVATGTGIAPIRSMLLDLLERADGCTATLFWGVRTERDLYYQDELDALARGHTNFSFEMTLSRPTGTWRGETGRVTRLVQERVSTVRGLSAYVCGNARMIADVTAILNTKGLCPIHREKYYDDPGPCADD
jgi:CDP-4-dehydro-6-deoxyglucose reductase, E3